METQKDAPQTSWTSRSGQSNKCISGIRWKLAKTKIQSKIVKIILREFWVSKMLISTMYADVNHILLRRKITGGQVIEF